MEDARRPDIDSSRLDDLQRRVDALRARQDAPKSSWTPSPASTRSPPLVTLRLGRRWRVLQIGLPVGVYLVVAASLGLWLGSFERLLPFLGWPIWWVLLAQQRHADSLTVSATGLTAGPSLEEFRWTEIVAIDHQWLWSIPKRVESMTLETARLSGKPRRLVVPLELLVPPWRETVLVGLLAQHRADLEVNPHP